MGCIANFIYNQIARNSVATHECVSLTKRQKLQSKITRTRNKLKLKCAINKAKKPKLRSTSCLAQHLNLWPMNSNHRKSIVLYLYLSLYLYLYVHIRILKSSSSSRRRRNSSSSSSRPSSVDQTGLMADTTTDDEILSRHMVVSKGTLNNMFLVYRNQTETHSRDFDVSRLSS